MYKTGMFTLISGGYPPPPLPAPLESPNFRRFHFANAGDMFLFVCEPV